MLDQGNDFILDTVWNLRVTRLYSLSTNDIFRLVQALLVRIGFASIQRGQASHIFFPNSHNLNLKPIDFLFLPTQV
jgi:hypothetical protein